MSPALTGGKREAVWMDSRGDYWASAGVTAPRDRKKNLRAEG